MKLRIRYKSTTKLLNLGVGSGFTIGHIRSRIKQELLSDLQILPGIDFDLSLNGHSSIGNDSLQADQAGLVSGDLLNIILHEDASTNTEIRSARQNLVDIQEAASYMSVAEQPTASNTSIIAEQPDVISDAMHHHERRPSSSVGSRHTSSNSMEDTVTHHGPLLLQDYKDGQALPSLLEDLYLLSNVSNDFQAICVALHNLMLESGFSLQPSIEINSALSSTVVTFIYTHPATQSLTFTLTCNKLGPFVMVNGLIHPCQNIDEVVLTTQIKISQFVTKFDSDSKPTESKNVYHNLSKLSRLFKENITRKALDNMRAELRLPPLYGILSLFPELLIRVMSHLGAPSLCSLSQTCHQLAEIADDDILWRALYIRTFSALPPNHGTSWKEMFKRRRLEQVRERREQEQFERERANEFEAFPSFTSYPDVPQPFPGQPSGILGGDYDLDPSFPYGPLGRGGRGGPNPLGPTRPRFSGPRNPMPGSRFDPINPFGGRFRPGRGGGMMDDFGMGLPRMPRRPRDRRGFDDFM